MVRRYWTWGTLLGLTGAVYMLTTGLTGEGVPLGAAGETAAVDGGRARALSPLSVGTTVMAEAADGKTGPSLSAAGPVDQRLARIQELKRRGEFRPSLWAKYLEGTRAVPLARAVPRSGG